MRLGQCNPWRRSAKFSNKITLSSMWTLPKDLERNTSKSLTSISTCFRCQATRSMHPKESEHFTFVRVAITQLSVLTWSQAEARREDLGPELWLLIFVLHLEKQPVLQKTKWNLTERTLPNWTDCSFQFWTRTESSTLSMEIQSDVSLATSTSAFPEFKVLPFSSWFRAS